MVENKTIEPILRSGLIKGGKWQSPKLIDNYLVVSSPTISCHMTQWGFVMSWLQRRKTSPVCSLT